MNEGQRLRALARGTLAPLKFLCQQCGNFRPPDQFPRTETGFTRAHSHACLPCGGKPLLMWIARSKKGKNQNDNV